MKKIIILISILCLLGCSSTNEIKPVYSIKKSASDRLASLTKPHTNVITDGNSLTAGTGAVKTTNYPAQLDALLDTSYTVTNKGINGITSQKLVTQFEQNILPLYKQGQTNIIVFWESRNDLYNLRDINLVYDDLINYCIVARSYGFKVIIIDMLPSWNAIYINDTTIVGYHHFDSDRLNFNSIVANTASIIADGYVPIGEHSLLGTLGQNENVGYVFSHLHAPKPNTYYYDGRHLNPTGYGIVAHEVYNEIIRITQ